MIDIDEMIEESRRIIMLENKLDISKEFMSLVHAEVQEMRVQEKVDYRLTIKRLYEDTIFKIKTTSFFGRCSGYINVIKTRLEKLYTSLRPQRSVRINRLFKLTDEEFIRELYRMILNREADEDGYKHNLKIIQNKEYDRLDMIYIFNSSSEGGRTPVKIKGKFWLRKKKEKSK